MLKYYFKQSIIVCDITSLNIIARSHLWVTVFFEQSSA